ncbi:MAG: kynureninase [Gemmatimonadota bacterium]
MADFETGEEFEAGEAFALALDHEDSLRGFRERFHIPPGPDGKPSAYFCGNSLGLQPRAAAGTVAQELEDWANLAVDGHFDARRPWYPYHEQFRAPLGRLVGALPHEVVAMNTLTVNLHLMMVSFFRPAGARTKILIESPAFPSDRYAVQTQLRHHGIDPADGLLELRPRDGEHTIRDEDIAETLERHGEEIALVLLGGVNFFTGQVFDMERVTALARSAGCRVGLDLAHAAGNVPLRLHDWDVDFAAWCSYKYLNAGPGAVAACFVHERNASDTSINRFGGWWGNDPATRFQMLLLPEFLPKADADGWQVSNPPVLALAPLISSLELFDEAGMDALRAKSVRLTGYLEWLLRQLPEGRAEIITPADPDQRGCQLSLLVGGDVDAAQAELAAAGIVSDIRRPNVIRVAPVPLYNSFHDCWRLAEALRA